MMEYKGYLGKVEFDDEAGLFGEVINTRDVITFQGRSVTELRRLFATPWKTISLSVQLVAKIRSGHSQAIS